MIAEFLDVAKNSRALLPTTTSLMWAEYLLMEEGNLNKRIIFSRENAF